MKSNLITLAMSLVVLVFTRLFSEQLLADPTAYTGYYVHVVTAISLAAAAISLFRLVHRLIRPPAQTGPPVKAGPEQRRASFRLSYDHDPPPRPIFVETRDEQVAADAFSCPVKDLSETGLSLLCTGVYTSGQTVHGEIIFTSGRTAPIHGRVIREAVDRTCIVLHCTIDPSIFMAEQRELIESQKDTGPRPAVNRVALAEQDGSLPSHRPKGICRIK